MRFLASLTASSSELKNFIIIAPIMHQHSLFRDIIVLIVFYLQIIDLGKGRENNLILNDNNRIIFQLKSVINI